MPFKRLVELTLGTTDQNLIRKYIEDYRGSVEQYEKSQKIEMERVYESSMLSKLFPNYSFYEKRNISQKTQKLYKTGLAGAGQLYRRMVFPIYNENAQIVGFSGRKVDEDSAAPKWKHLGKKANWVYPARIPDFEPIEDEVILVESIGDSMALTQNGYANNLVTFGLDCGSGLLNFLVSQSLSKVIIATNNDFEGKKNRGLIGAVKILMKLSGFFDYDMLEIKLPTKNDFSEMNRSGDDFIAWKSSEKMSNEQILDFCKLNAAEFKKDKLDKFRKMYLL